MAEKFTDVYHLSIAGANPHDIARDINDQDSPFHDDIGNGSVKQQIVVDDKLVGGTVEVWAAEHLTAEQERYLKNNPHVIDVRHAWPNDEDDGRGGMFILDEED